MTAAEIAELQNLTQNRRWKDVARIIEPLSRRKLDGSLFPHLLPLLTVTDYAIYKYAITAVGKMKKPPREAFDAVLSAWQSTWIGDCPQCTSEALKALQVLDPASPRLIQEIERCLAVDNYQVHKACAEALMSINTAAARQVLSKFETYLPRQYTEKVMIDLLERIRNHVASAP